MSKSVTPINTRSFELCLVLTEQCNLNCVYCFNDKSSRKKMSKSTAFFEIDKAINHNCSAERFDILFMGGEPFLAFDLMKDIIEYVDLKHGNKNVFYTVITNGTILDNEIKRFIKLNQKRFQVVFSIDGDDDTQNSNRFRSKHKIDWDFLSTEITKPIVNMVITPDTLKDFAKNSLFLHSKNVYVKSFLADGVVWKEENINDIISQLRILIDYYMEHPQVVPISLLTMPIYYVSHGAPTRCGDENNTYTIAADGTKYACHRCSPFENKGPWSIPEELIDLKGARHLNEQACPICCVANICNACPASNASILGSPDYEERSSTECKIRKVIFKMNALFYYKLLTEMPGHDILKRFANDKKIALIESTQLILTQLNVSIPF